MGEILERFDFDEAYKQSRSELYGYAFKLSGNSDNAEDLFSHAWLKFIKGLNGAHSYDPLKSRITTYVCGIIRNLWIDQLRKSSKSKTLSLDDALDNSSDCYNHIRILRGAVEKAIEFYDDEPQIHVDEDNALVRRVLDSLPPEYRTALELTYFSGLSCKDIAKRENLTHQTSRWRIHNARKIFEKNYLKLLRA